MSNNVTRQLCASAYLTPGLSEKIISFVKNPYKAIVHPPGLDPVVLLKHALNARSKERRFYALLFIPSLLCILTLPLLPIALLFLTIIFLAVLVRYYNNKRFIKEHFITGNFNYNFSYDGSEKELIHQLQENTTKNVVYYSGYSPFVGCGYEVGGWSFVIDIDKGKTDLGQTLAPKSFQEDELYYIVSQELLQLKLENLSIENKIYFNGKDLRNNKDILPNIFRHPVTEVNSEYTKKAMNYGVENARFYKMIQVTGWEGDLVLSAFLRFKKGEKTLFVENNYYLLPPIKDEYRAVDRIKQDSGIRHFLRLMTKLFLISIVETIRSVSYVFGQISKGIKSLFGISPEAKLRKEVKISPDYDYGAHSSIREMVCQSQYFQHFQKLDKERFLKTIDKRIFNGITEFLDSKNISTEEFKTRENIVMNNGIIVQSGGVLTSQNVSAGIGASIRNMMNPGNPGKAKAK
ncbi:hypothetical protein FAM09_10590 [Niastella caeni]|uniref:DUF3137 domain-containing protein n=1 Tax=Niastella caeni TaxID=2569763 RepID=A0A4V4H1F8_9BACT|nr:hypothetical protein [Niastella caeni]THU40306.1 hypothetical protein FAM09_10590 [Niastella caeni]